MLEIEQARRLADQKAHEAQLKENEARDLEEQLREAKLRVSSFVCPADGCHSRPLVAEIGNALLSIFFSP